MIKLFVSNEVVLYSIIIVSWNEQSESKLNLLLVLVLHYIDEIQLFDCSVQLELRVGLQELLFGVVNVEFG